ncbi:hypothetical protein HDU97_006569 [Phlyctochytrium planicorne]|nr:hypothetical protein HDU97_006569 [Phlyctochytrium planicorne]
MAALTLTTSEDRPYTPPPLSAATTINEDDVPYPTYGRRISDPSPYPTYGEGLKDFEEVELEEDLVEVAKRWSTGFQNQPEGMTEMKVNRQPSFILRSPSPVAPPTTTTTATVTKTTPETPQTMTFMFSSWLTSCATIPSSFTACLYGKA